MTYCVTTAVSRAGGIYNMIRVAYSFSFHVYGSFRHDWHARFFYLSPGRIFIETLWKFFVPGLSISFSKVYPETASFLIGCCETKNPTVNGTEIGRLTHILFGKLTTKRWRLYAVIRGVQIAKSIRMEFWFSYATRELHHTIGTAFSRDFFPVFVYFHQCIMPSSMVYWQEWEDGKSSRDPWPHLFSNLSLVTFVQ